MASLATHFSASLLLLPVGMHRLLNSFSLYLNNPFIFHVSCGFNDDRTRGVALMNLLFVGHAIGVLIVSIVTFGMLAINRNLRRGEASRPFLAQLQAESALAMPCHPEIELE